VGAIDRRVGWIFLAFLILLGAAVGRALWLGSVRADSLQKAAFAEQVTVNPVPASRGAITDANGVQLALSQTVDDVIADPYLIVRSGQAQPMAAAIAPLLHMPTLTVLSDLTKPHTGYSPVAKQVAPAVAQKILGLRIKGEPINGIYTNPDLKRVYPRTWEASQVLGFVNGSQQGASGLEAYYNKQLAGTPGERKTVNNPRTGTPISVQDTKPMQPGKSLKLTVSAPLQDEVEQVLAGIGAQYQPKSATAIVMNPHTGAIMALGNWPRINDNNPYGGASPSVVNNAIQDHAVSLTYEPGSTFKAITVAGALQDGKVTPNTSFDVPPDLSVYGSVIHDSESHGYEALTTAGILKVSSNIGADLIGQKLGATRFNYWVHRFGLGANTGIDLPGEAPGFILAPSKYSGTSMYNLPFGQGEAVTPIQMATAYSAIANGGILRSPHIVSAIGDHTQPLPHGHRIISPTTASQLRNMLRGVLADGGTASGADIPGYDLAGKTGTANVVVDGKYSNSEYIASFIGMVPASDPKLVVAVVVDEPQGGIYGGSVAAPAFQKIVGWAVPYFGINPDPAHVRPNP
jgi:cell division protein FtsI/penicillin-binding protein 2